MTLTQRARKLARQIATLHLGKEPMVAFPFENYVQKILLEAFEEVTQQPKHPMEEMEAYAKYCLEIYAPVKMKELRMEIGQAEITRILARIADAFDANELDDEARRFWGSSDAPHDLTKEDGFNPQNIILFQGRGGKALLTLADCFRAREALTGAPPTGNVPTIVSGLRTKS